MIDTEMRYQEVPAVSKDVVRQALVVLAVVAVVVVNALANALPLNGQTTGEIADRFEVLFIPAGYVFSIWGLIYLGLIAYAAYQALPSQRDNSRLQSIAYLFVLSGAANIAWIFLWHYEVFIWTLLAMGVLLGSLIAIYLRLEIGRARVHSGEKWLVHVPFSIYLGWITVATISNVAVVLDFLNWDGFGISPEVWTVFALVVAGAITSAVVLTRRDVAYVLVIIWALIGVAVRNVGVPAVATAALIVSALVALVTVLSVLRERP